MEVLLILSTVFSALVLVGLLVLLTMAVWFIRQLQIAGQPRVIISRSHPKQAP